MNRLLSVLVVVGLSAVCRAGIFSSAELSCSDCLIIGQHIQAEMLAIDSGGDGSLLQSAG